MSAIPSKILVVDDEEFNLEIIAEFLGSAEFELSSFTSADAAWAHLQTNTTHYDLVLLDRMMPGMDGMEFLRLFKSDARFDRLPVIMQTAAASVTEVNEGIAAGAYYYLAKPYAAAQLLAIVRAALLEFGQAAPPPQAPIEAVKGEFVFRTLLDARVLAAQLAALCPSPDLVTIGLAELLLNAIEHGNLGLTYADKKRLRLADGWEHEVERRLADASYADRWARVTVERQDTHVIFVVTDDGAGFDWHRYLEIDPARAYDPNGRGIALARQLSFKELRYEGRGNIAVAIVGLGG